MTYSRTGWWSYKTAGIGLLLAAVMVVRWLHPGKPIAGLLLIAAIIVAVGLGLRAFLYRDEIQRHTRMRCWYYGSQIGAVLAALWVIAIFFFGFPDPGAIIKLFVHINPHINPALPEASFRVGAAFGLSLLAISQTVGALLVRGYLALPARERS